MTVLALVDLWLAAYCAALTDGWGYYEVASVACSVVGP